MIFFLSLSNSTSAALLQFVILPLSTSIHTIASCALANASLNLFSLSCKALSAFLCSVISDMIWTAPIRFPSLSIKGSTLIFSHLSSISKSFVSLRWDSYMRANGHLFIGFGELWSSSQQVRPIISLYGLFKNRVIAVLHCSILPSSLSTIQTPSVMALKVLCHSWAETSNSCFTSVFFLWWYFRFLYKANQTRAITSKIMLIPMKAPRAIRLCLLHRSSKTLQALLINSVILLLYACFCASYSGLWSKAAASLYFLWFINSRASFSIVSSLSSTNTLKPSSAFLASSVFVLKTCRISLTTASNRGSKSLYLISQSKFLVTAAIMADIVSISSRYIAKLSIPFIWASWVSVVLICLYDSQACHESRVIIIAANNNNKARLLVENK